MRLEWEKVDDTMAYIQRAKIPGGWLVQAHIDVAHIGNDKNEYITTGYDWRVSITFVPDPFHAWELV